jgi:hypothetical protein
MWEKKVEMGKRQNSEVRSQESEYRQSQEFGRGCEIAGK